jgi:acyl-CoA synthetase (NDP forming)
VSSPITPARVQRLFRPDRIAVVGASDKSYFSRTLVTNLERFGRGDRVHLVNARSVAVHDRRAAASVAAIGESIDLAFMMVPEAATADALSEAAAAGVHSAVLLTSGYAEAGADGRVAQKRLVEHAERLGMVLLGPNCLGFANFVDGIPATTIPNLPDEAGSVALLSQSGASSGAMMEFARSAGVGLSHLVTLGNEAMLTAAQTLEFAIDDERTAVVAMFLETIRQPDAFRAAAARARAAGKPVVVLKAGRSELAARSAAAHTGALVGNDAAIDAVFTDLGVIRVDTIEDLLVTAGAAANLGRLARPGVGVVSISGGACDVVADLAAASGLALPELTAATVDALREVLPAYGTAQNPLDATGAAVIDPSLMTHAVAAVGSDPAVGVVLAINKLPWRSDDEPFAGQPFVDAVGKGRQLSVAPVVFVNQVSQPITPVTRTAMRRAGLPYAICGLGAAVTALEHLTWWSARPAPADAPAAQGRHPRVVRDAAARIGTWSEDESRQLLVDAGIDVVPALLCSTADEAVAAAASFGGRVAVKVSSAQILHKTDVGGVQLDVSGPAEVRAAFEDVTAAGRHVPGAIVDGALVSPMRSGGTELLVGVIRDPDWGLLITIALGGVLVEVVRDAAIAALPTSASRVRELLTSLRGAALLSGARGTPPADMDALVRTIVRITDVAQTLGADLESLEVNPLHVAGGRIEVLDALVTWRDETIGAP